MAIRARCVLLAARGVGTRAIARTVGRTPRWARLWRDRFARDRLNGLVDAGRSGRPPRFSPRHQEFVELLQALRRRWPRGRLVVVADNLSIHTHPNVRAWVVAQQGRVELVFLPVHASWLNQIELWFSVLERQCLKRASLCTHVAMAARIYAFTRHWNRTARPFRWTFKGYPLRR